MSPEKMIGLSFAAPAAKLYEVLTNRRRARNGHGVFFVQQRKPVGEIAETFLTPDSFFGECVP